jgi:predicted DNA-binding transcriptional regulator AlpA
MIDKPKKTDATLKSKQEEYLSDHSFCGMLEITPRTSRSWRRDGISPPYIRLGLRRILYKKSDVEAWLARQTHLHRAAEVVVAEKNKHF